MSIGELIVDVIRTEIGVELYAAGTFAGPFPSGAPAIFTDQAARMGHDTAFIGSIGDDDFGKTNLDRFARDGVDATWVKKVEGLATGCAFVTYFADGSRKFLFHIGNSAAGQLPEPEAAMFAGCAWLHICGSSLSASEAMRNACYKAVDLATAAGAKVSFDPNLRPELLGGQEALQAICGPIMAKAALILPSSQEAEFLTGISEADAACQAMLDGGAEIVALKRDSSGSRIFTADGTVDVSSFEVEQVDPTGAGDSFGGGFVAMLNEGRDVETAARVANACGALSVTKRGPMEGCPDRETAFALAGVAE